MASKDYLEDFAKKAKAMLPEWMHKEIHNSARAHAGGKTPRGLTKAVKQWVAELEEEPVEKQASGIMVCLYLPQHISSTIAMQGGEKAEDLHVTLAYLPGIGDDKDGFEKVRQAVESVAEEFAEVEGWIGGIGLFNGSDSLDGKDVYYASFNSPVLPALQSMVMTALEVHGLLPSRKHGFTPHVTLKYLDPMEAFPSEKKASEHFKIPAISIASKTIPAVSVPLTGKRVLKSWEEPLEAIMEEIQKSQPASSSVHVNVPMGSEEEKSYGLVEPDIANLEVEVLKELNFEVERPIDKTNVESLMAMQAIVAATDWEMANGIEDEDEAREAALDNLDDDPEYYLEKVGATDALNLDLCSGPCRQPGYLGLDVYPHDHGTLVHDLTEGIPFGDNTARSIRLVNGLSYMGKEHADFMLKEAQRVLKPGGSFVYEGPNELGDYFNWTEHYPGLVMTNHEETREPVDKESVEPWVKQEYTRTVIPDAATADDAEPEYGVDGDLAEDEVVVTTKGMDGYAKVEFDQRNYVKLKQALASFTAMFSKFLAEEEGDQSGEKEDKETDDDKPKKKKEVKKDGDWDESKHPRDDHGRFGEGGGGSQNMKDHPNYSASDHAHLKGKGYSDKEIKDIWDRDHAQGKGPTNGPRKLPDVTGRLGRTSERLTQVGGKKTDWKDRTHSRTGHTQSVHRGEKGDAVVTHKPESSMNGPAHYTWGSFDRSGKSVGTGSHRELGQAKNDALDALYGSTKKSDERIAKTFEDTRVVPIKKFDKKKQIVYCVVLSPEELDAQDDWMTSEDIEDAAHYYMMKSRVIGADHSRKIDAQPVESYIAPQDLNWDDGPYGPQIVKKGAWVLGIKIHDPKEWAKAEQGGYQGVSVGGFGKRT